MCQCQCISVCLPNVQKYFNVFILSILTKKDKRKEDKYNLGKLKKFKFYLKKLNIPYN